MTNRGSESPGFSRGGAVNTRKASSIRIGARILREKLGFNCSPISHVQSLLSLEYMTEYLERFLKLHRINVDPELIERWEFDARYHGDKNIKAQMATARRTATILQKSITQFSNMRSEQELAVKKAAIAMRSLAGELEGLSSWAKTYHLFCNAERKKDRKAELETIANNRWGQDNDAMAFEMLVINNLRSGKGKLAFARWMQQRTDCDFKHFAADRIYDPISDYSSWVDGQNPRIEFAEKIEEGMQRSSRSVSFCGKHLHCSWFDYELYLTYRKQVSATSKRIVQIATATNANPGSA